LRSRARIRSAVPPEAHSYSAIARMYEVSDTAVRKWCLKDGLTAKVARRKA